MRFHIGAVPKTESSDFPPGQWSPLRHDFKPLVMQLFAWPVGGIVFVIVGWLWIQKTPAMKNMGHNPNALLVELIVTMLALFPIHEFLHAVTHPDFGISHKTIFGAWPSHLLFYVRYDGVLSRNRFIAIFAMPLLVITSAPLLIAFVSGHASILVAFLSSLNALGAGIDIFSIVILLWQVPSGAEVFNQGEHTYWTPCTKK
jgi:hypothetical protein